MSIKIGREFGEELGNSERGAKQVPIDILVTPWENKQTETKTHLCSLQGRAGFL